MKRLRILASYSHKDDNVLATGVDTMNSNALASAALLAVVLLCGVTVAPGADRDTNAKSFVRFDFEQGGLQGWKIVQGCLDPDAGEKSLLQACAKPDGKLGQFSLATYAPRCLYSPGKWIPWLRWAGTVESPVFVIAGSEATFMLGGKSAPPDRTTVWLALCTEDGREVRRATPVAVGLAPHRWDLGELIGQRVFLRLVDRPGVWGFIAVDNFEAAGTIDHQATERRWRDLERLRTEDMRPVREAFEQVGELVFVARPHDVDPHYYTCFGRDCLTGAAMYPIGSQLCRLEPRSGAVRILLDDPQGTIQDPRVSYDVRRILFSYRPGGSEHFHLYEIDADGTRLRQITDGPFDDIEPTYLPDGGILFCSSRCQHYVPCWRVPAAVLYTCRADGSGLRPLSPNKEMENTPCMLPDGRVLYTRWEYVDRNHVAYHHLWSTNPDGTSQATYFGNMLTSYADIVGLALVMIDARPVPNSHNVVAVFCDHMSPDHAGYVAVIDPRQGPDVPSAVTRITCEDISRDPVPLGQSGFLVAQYDRLAVVSYHGYDTSVYRLPEELRRRGLLIHEPQVFVSRPREPILPSRVATDDTTGRVIMEDIYRGRNMNGVRRGEIKDLLVLEGLPKPINFTGGMAPISYYGTFSLARVLGTVPVEPDGSAHMELPALRELFFVARDENGRSVKRMQGFLCLQPGERTGCIGCHEWRTQAPVSPAAGSVLALARSPSRIEPIASVPDVFDFPRDVQPILDRQCVACHDYEATDQGGPRAGGVVLTGDRGPWFSHSYATLFMHDLVSHGDNLAKSNYPPRALGSAASRLLELTDGRHYKSRLSTTERQLLTLWIDAGANYAGTYAALGTGMLGFNTKTLETDQRLNNVYRRSCRECHHDATALPRNNFAEVHHGGHGSVRQGLVVSRVPKVDPARRLSGHVAFNLSRPERSTILLAPLASRAGGYGICRRDNGQSVFRTTNDPDYKLLLGCIQDYRAQLNAAGRFEIAGFRPHEMYVRRMQHYGVLPSSFDRDTEPLDVYAADRAYWRSLWYRPTPK